MASGKTLQMRYINGPLVEKLHDSFKDLTYTGGKDRRLAGKKRIRQRRLDKRQ